MTRPIWIGMGALLLASGACGSDPAQPPAAMTPSMPNTAPAQTQPAQAQPAQTQPARAQAAAAAGSPAVPANAMPANAAPSPAANGGMPASMMAAVPPMPSPPSTGPVSDKFMSDAGDGWKTLIAGRWEVPPGQETYVCARFTLPETITASSFRALSPPGTHHTLLTIIDAPTEPDGTKACTASTNGRKSITGSGVGSNDLTMPEGVAMQVKAGTQVLLNLHLFNVTEKPITGTSGTLWMPVAAEAVKQYAEGVLAGQINLSIPAGGPTTQSGDCTTTHDTTVFAVSPHMHQLGVHLKAVAHSSVDGDVVLLDSPYSFDEQLVYPLKQEVRMKKGDKFHVECTYQNTTGKPVMFGESSLSEMCFAGIYRYPAGDPGFVCVR